MKKKMRERKREKKSEGVGLKARMMGAKTVDPNMASTCCRPTKMVCPQGSRSSGAMIPSVLRVQPVRYPGFSVTVAMNCPAFQNVLQRVNCGENVRTPHGIARVWPD